MLQAGQSGVRSLDRLWGTSCILLIAYLRSLARGKEAGAMPTYECVELYLYFPYVPSWCGTKKGQNKVTLITFDGSAIVQTVSRWLLTAETRVR